MLTFNLISCVDGFYHYEIYPEGKEENKGWVIFNPETWEVKEKVNPKSSFECIGHFLQGVTDENGNYKESGMVAWC
ncbi:MULTISPECIES: hypothetical protein [Aerococcus]|nr:MULTISPECIES: hypothetical protein [Aerococcus]MDL5183604.1 hypothetical protein [Aerococcus mictus]KAA9299550.1 hypothetical protein F6I08_02825 [Aerococcus tenax]MDK6291423.1 hypothetical protein [Aerococcus urinae]MDK6372432.1 hypothetical protein [Aerococcus urinae]MDK6375853.1 hypothetical protein [Aerococcus urinae]